MVRETPNWVKSLAVAVLLLCTRVPVSAQSGGSLTGKLTDLHSSPLAGATVVLRNQSTGAETRTITAKDGVYRFSALGAGQYILEADSPQLGHAQLNGIQVSAGHEAHIQAAVQFDLAPSAPAHSVFLENPQPFQPPQYHPAPTIAAALPLGQPIPTITATLSITLPTESPRLLPSFARLVPAPPLDPPPAQTALLTASLPPAPRPALLIAALPATDLPTVAALHPASVTASPTPVKAAALTVVRTLPGIPHLPAIASVASGILAAAQWSVPRSIPIQAASQRDDPASPSVTPALSANELQSLPATGRRWEEFALDTPAANDGSSESTLHSGNQQPADTTVDGASTQLAFDNGSNSSRGADRQSTSTDEPAGIGLPSSSGRGFFVSEPAIRQVQTFAAIAEPRGVQSSGGRFNVETQRGSNGLHGQVFLFDRQNNWGARNPAAQWVTETAPDTSTLVPVFTAQPFTPPDHEITWGIGAGSHILRNKLFWFAALDNNQRNDPALSTVKHPYLCANPPQCTGQTGFFAQPANDQMQLLGAQLGTSTSAALAKYSQMLETLAGLLGPAPRVSSQWAGFGRIDWNAAERHSFTLEGTGATFNSPGGGLSRVSEFYGNHSLGSSQATRQWLLARWQAYLTPNLLAASQATVGRAILSAHAQTPSAFEQTLNQNVWGQLPQIVVDSRYGFTIGKPSRFGHGSYPDESYVRAQQSLDWVRGNLLIRAGVSLAHNLDSTSLLRNQTGTYHYATVENFAADALVFAANGFSDALDKFHQHNCDETGRVWHDAIGQLRGLGNLPCYSYYTQTMGPTNWYLSTNDWAGFATAQWQPSKIAVVSIGLRWEREQLPPPIAALANPALPLAGKMPHLGDNWGPRISVSFGGAERHWPVLRLGYGMYFSRIRNANLETALTQTGSLNGDLNFFVRPTDNLHAGGAPPFPYVFAGEPLKLVKPAAVEFAPNFRNPEVHQAVVSLEESLPGHIQLAASAVLSLARRLPVSVDSNFDPAVNPGTITYQVVDGTGKGPIKASQITVPFYANWPSSTSGTGTAGRLNPNYQQISEVFSRANSTYEAAILRLSRNDRHGVSLHARYTYAHAMDWNPNESTQLAGNDVLDPQDFSHEYGTSNLDVRHSGSVTAILAAPWKLHNLAGIIANGWMLSGIGQFRSGLPYTMRTSGSLPKEFNRFTGDVIAALGPGMNGSAGDNRIYGLGSDKVFYNVGRNTYRYPFTWKADLRLAKQFDLGHLRQLQLLAESFNLFNHQNVTQVETTGYTISPGTLAGAFPTLTFLTGLKANTTAFGKPRAVNATNYYRERQIQFGLRMRF